MDVIGTEKNVLFAATFSRERRIRPLSNGSLKRLFDESFASLVSLKIASEETFVGINRF